MTQTSASEYLTPTKNHWACDIEADNLLPLAKKIHCVCVENVITGEKHAFTKRQDFWDFCNRDDVGFFIGHNFLAYDLIMLNRFWQAEIPTRKIIDTFVLSQLYNPSMSRPPGITKKKGPHSLEAWGIRLRFPKTGHADFSVCTPEMIGYCQNDTALTALLYRKLSERMRQVGFSEDGCKIEHDAWHIIQNKQYRHGFPFNQRKALELYAGLRKREAELQEEIYKLWPPRLCVVGEYKTSSKKDGGDNLQFIRHREQYPKVERSADGSYRVYDYVAFNLGSPQQRIAKLIELGWTPSSYTKRTAKGGGGNPQVNEDELLLFAEESGIPELKALALWLVVNSRANMINTWLNAYNEETGAIHGKLFLASTLRYKHSAPNSANIPAVRSGKDKKPLFGEAGAWAYECRDLWDCGRQPGWCLVGIDATGIQNRCLIHHLINTVGEEAVAEFKALALSGDIHEHNIRVLGLAHKAAAKKFYYTLMMGGGGALLAADQVQFGTHMSAAEGEAKKRKLVAGIPGFGVLIKNLQKELADTGRIRLCDETPILVPSPHMVIPYLLQGDESRIMKRSMYYVDQAIRAEKAIDKVFKVADIHDEWQYKVRREYAEDFIQMALPCFGRAGDSFGYRIRIDGDAKVGMTWAETH